MRKLPLARFVVLAVGALAAAATSAHHGAPGYDFSKPVSLDGTVVEVQWKNPHVYFVVESRGADGRPRRLEIEAASLSAVQAFGLQRKMLPAGTPVKFLAFGRLRDPESANYKGVTVTLPDGSVYYLENTPEPRPVREAIAARALAGKWVPASSASFGEFIRADAMARARGQPSPQQAGTGGQVAVNADADANASCAGMERNVTLPFASAALYVLRSLQLGDRTVHMDIDADGFVLKRTVDLASKEHPAKLAPAQLGHSIGHWEGQTLVIDTIGFAPRSGAFTQSERKHLVERLSLTDDHRHLRYEFTVEDPGIYRETFRYGMLWDHRPDLTMSAAACDDGIARKFRSVK